MNLFKAIYTFFDKFEDDVRGTLSRHVFIYTFIGGVGLILFWRGIWHIADVLEGIPGSTQILFSPAGSLLLGVAILLSTGLFVSVFVGDSIIMSGIRKDKKVIDKTIEEIEEEKSEVEETEVLLMGLKKEVEKLERKLNRKSVNKKKVQ